MKKRLCIWCRLCLRLLLVAVVCGRIAPETESGARVALAQTPAEQRGEPKGAAGLKQPASSRPQPRVPLRTAQTEGIEPTEGLKRRNSKKSNGSAKTRKAKGSEPEREQRGAGSQIGDAASRFRPVRLAVISDSGFLAVDDRKIKKFRHLETVERKLLDLTNLLNPGYVVENAIWTQQSMLRLLSRTHGIDVLVSLVGASGVQDSEEKGNEPEAVNEVTPSFADAQRRGFARFFYFSESGEIIRQEVPLKKATLPRISAQLLRDLGFNGIIKGVQGKRIQIESVSGDPFRQADTGAIALPFERYVFSPYSPRKRSRAIFKVLSVRREKAVAEVTFQVDEQIDLREGDLVWVGPEPDSASSGRRP